MKSLPSLVHYPQEPLRLEPVELNGQTHAAPLIPVGLPLQIPQPASTRARSESGVDGVRRETERLRLSSLAFNGGEESNTPKENVEYRKSKSLTRKIKELASREASSSRSESPAVRENDKMRSNGRLSPSREILNEVMPLPVGHLNPLPLTRESSLTSNASNSGNNTPSVGQNGAKTRGNILQSPLTMLKHSLHVPTISQADQTLSPTIADRKDLESSTSYQHYTFPKSLNASSNAANMKSSQNTNRAGLRSEEVPIEHIPVSRSVLADADQSMENDRILQERLQQAKAMNRKDEDGAVMHKFSLWRRFSDADARVAEETSLVVGKLRSTSDVPADIAGKDEALVQPKLVSRLRNHTQGIAPALHPLQRPADQHLGTGSALLSQAMGSSARMVEPEAMRSRASSDLSDSYSDEEFVETDESGVGKEKEPRSKLPTIDIPAKHNSRSLASSLRVKVLDAHNGTVDSGCWHRRNSENSFGEGMTLEVLDEVEQSYSSFANKTKHRNKHDTDQLQTLDGNLQIVEDFESIASVESEDDLQRVALVRSQSVNLTLDMGSSQHSIMSKSGPVVFGSRASFCDENEQGNNNQPELPPVEKSRHASVMCDNLAGIAFSIDLESAKNAVGRQAEKTQHTSETTKKLSKYQVLRNLRSAGKKNRMVESREGKSDLQPILTDLPMNESISVPPAPNPMRKVSANLTGGLGVLDDTEEKIIEVTSCSNHFGVKKHEEQMVPNQLKWKKGEAIGEGSFGKVFKGLNEKTGELLAIKQFCLADGSEKEVEELQKEIHVMWELHHENIVRYLGTSRTERYLFILLEYVTGGSIASMLAQFGSFTEDLIRRFAYHILSGITYLHSKGIIHRDIKGANILVTDTGVAKLADFGCSKRLAGMCTNSLEESMSVLRGSIPWMAPEVIKQAGYGRSSDIWSFGATMIEMATGKPPWSQYSDNLAALFHVATSNSPPVIPDHLSASCAEFVKSCLVIAPENRSTAMELLQSSDFLHEIRQTMMSNESKGAPSQSKASHSEDAVELPPASSSSSSSSLPPPAAAAPKRRHSNGSSKLNQHRRSDR